jgi:hypothetical protein
MQPRNERSNVTQRRSLVVLIALCVVAEAGCATRAVPPRQAPEASASSTLPSQPSRDRSARTYGWVSLSVGVEATAVALVTSGMMLHEKNVRDGHCDAQKVCSTDGANANASLSQLGWWNAAAWVVAAAGLGVGGYLLWSHPTEGRASTTGLAVGPVGTGMGLELGSGF